MTTPARAPVRSMTGSATVTGLTSAGVGFSLSIKSVNHRFLDLRLSLPPGSDTLEASLRALVRERVRRGHVELTLAFEHRQSSGLRLNREILAGYLAAFAEAAEAHGLFDTPDLNALLRMPGVMTTEAAVSSLASERVAADAAIVERAGELLDYFDRSRAEEGAALEAVLRASVVRIDQLAAEIADLRGNVRPAHFDRLRSRMTDLLAGAGISEERILAEAALLAERSDIEEEIVRLRAHAARFLAILDTGGEVGKRLDFLLQEFGREANTMLSKTGSAAGTDSLRITEAALDIKAEIERVREQVQNLE